MQQMDPVSRGSKPSQLARLLTEPVPLHLMRSGRRGPQPVARQRELYGYRPGVADSNALRDRAAQQVAAGRRIGGEGQYADILRRNNDLENRPKDRRGFPIVGPAADRRILSVLAPFRQNRLLPGGGPHTEDAGLGGFFVVERQTFQCCGTPRDEAFTARLRAGIVFEIGHSHGYRRTGPGKPAGLG